MHELAHFFEKETNKQINILEYNNQKLKDNQELVKFNNKTYIIEVTDKFVINNITGHVYLIYQQDVDFDSLKRILSNLYEDINIFANKKYFIVNSKTELDIDESTPEIIESETYRNTHIIYIGKIDNLDIFNNRLSVLDKVFPIIIKDSYSSKFIDLHDLTIYKTIDLIGNEKYCNNLMDFENIKNMDENLLYTGINFIENDLNITKTSNSLFLHRNTLIYRLEKIKEILNLDLKNFRDSFVFYLSIKSYLAYHK